MDPRPTPERHHIDARMTPDRPQVDSTLTLHSTLPPLIIYHIHIDSTLHITTIDYHIKRPRRLTQRLANRGRRFQPQSSQMQSIAQMLARRADFSTGRPDKRTDLARRMSLADVHIGPEGGQRRWQTSAFGYKYTYVYTCIYIYIYTHREPSSRFVMQVRDVASAHFHGNCKN